MTTTDTPRTEIHSHSVMQAKCSCGWHGPRREEVPATPERRAWQCVNADMRRHRALEHDIGVWPPTERERNHAAVMRADGVS